jgi:endonuclease YncB( thermonuclease family)
MQTEIARFRCPLFDEARKRGARGGMATAPPEIALRVHRFGWIAAAGPGALALCLLAWSAHASEAGADACGGLDPATGATQGVEVAAVEPGLDLRLADGRRITLAGIDPVRATQARPDFDEAARQNLAAWLTGRTVLVQTLTPAPDRWDRWPALVFAAPQARSAPLAPQPRLSVAAALLDAGLARVRPEPLMHGCHAIFMMLEAGARAARLGLWADPFYAILAADDRPALESHLGGMALVEGIPHLHPGRFRTLLALAPGSASLAVTVTPRSLKLLAKAGLDLAAMTGRRIRIRGFLDDRFGLRIDLTDPDQIELLAPEAGAQVRMNAAGEGAASPSP